MNRKEAAAVVRELGSADCEALNQRAIDGGFIMITEKYWDHLIEGIATLLEAPTRQDVIEDMRHTTGDHATTDKINEWADDLDALEGQGGRNG